MMTCQEDQRPPGLTCREEADVEEEAARWTVWTGFSECRLCCCVLWGEEEGEGVVLAVLR